MSERRDSFNYRALADFRLQLRKFLALSAEAAREEGIDPTQHQLLLVIKGHQPAAMNIGDIAEWLLIRHNSAVELVTRCERNGWVERVRDESDRRAVLVQLTPKGESVLSDLSAVHMQELRTTGPALINTLNRILEQLPTSENS